MNLFRIPTRVTAKPGCVEDLPQVVRELNAQRVMLVHGEGVGATRWPVTCRSSLAGAGLDVEVFDRIESNPRHTTVNKLGERLREGAFEAVIGLGGGSTLDAAKVAAMVATNDKRCEDCEGKEQFEKDPLPFVAMPTTCGSGSEVTWVSVITREDERRKISVKGESMFPNRALVDANLLTTLPRWLVASTGVDALTHAVEAYIGRASNPASDALAETAVALVFRHLPGAVSDIERNRPAREGVMLASVMAGMAFGNADVASVHCLSESIGGVVVDVPHGLANAVLLPAVLKYQSHAAESKLARLALVANSREAGDAVSSGGSDGEQIFIAAVEKLLAEVGIPGFEVLGLRRKDHELVARMAEENGSNASSPTTMKSEDYLRILENLA